MNTGVAGAMAARGKSHAITSVRSMRRVGCRGAGAAPKGRGDGARAVARACAVGRLPAHVRVPPPLMKRRNGTAATAAAAPRRRKGLRR